MRAQASNSFREITPHPALRATFPRLGEGFPHGKSLRFNRKLCRYAKDSPFGRGGTA